MDPAELVKVLVAHDDILWLRQVFFCFLNISISTIDSLPQWDMRAHKYRKLQFIYLYALRTESICYFLGCVAFAKEIENFKKNYDQYCFVPFAWL